MEAVIQGCRIAYRFEEAQQNQAETVLLLHGWGCDGSIFSSFVSELVKHASVLIVDFPGHGQSGEPPVPWGVGDYASQILALLDSLEIQKVHLIAHSFGGRVAIWLSSHAPERIGKMVITGGAGILKKAPSEQNRRQMQYKRMKALLNWFDRFVFLKPIISRLQEMLIQKYGSPDYKRLSSGMRQTFVKVINQDLSEYLPQIQASTLLVWGSNDTETPLWMGQKMEQVIPDAGLVVFEGRSHFAFIEEALRFRLIVDTFFWGGNAA